MVGRLFHLQALMFICCSISFISRTSYGARPRFEPSADALIVAETYRSVLDYGAVGDGTTVDSNAFLEAWGDLCNTADDSPTLEVPAEMTFLLQPLTFQGPCRSNNFHILVRGTIRAPEWSRSDPPQPPYWIRFSKVSGLLINGDGLIDGRGRYWWHRFDNSIPNPKALHFHACNGLQLRDLTHVDSPGAHISVNQCTGATLSNLTIRAPRDSPNTDGIDISRSSNVQIYDSFIGTGDDCIAINGGSSFINISGINCGPGHGISIGSLGIHNDDTVEEVYVNNCNFTGTQNGVRIKTWEGGVGYARKITFEDINFVEVHNPIIVNQHYVGYKIGNGAGVDVSDVIYRNVQGTSTSKIAINFDCGSIGCTNLRTDQVSIASAIPGKDVSASCNNAEGTSTSTTPDIPWPQS